MLYYANMSSILYSILKLSTYHVFLPLIIAELSTLKQVWFFGPPCSYFNRVLTCVAGVKVNAFTCVRWQLTLRDPIWQTMLCSSAMGFVYKAIRHLNA